MPDLDLVIIGAGAAGIGASRAAAKAGLAHKVIEAYRGRPMQYVPRF